MSGDEIIKYDNKLKIYIFSDMDIYLFACITFKFLKAQLILSKILICMTPFPIIYPFLSST